MPNKPGNDDRNTATGAGADVGASQAQGGSVPQRTRSNRGFASMDREKQKEIASKGGKAAHAKGTAHEFDSGEAREAGRKGGVAVSRNREHMAAIGRRGGEARGHSRARGSAQTNTGSSDSMGNGATQNSQRPLSSSTERQVAIDNQADGVNANPQGARGGNSSLGGERRPANGLDANTSGNSNRSEGFGNH
jgi:general stress protein YciG